eukprot:CAMPEP_0170996788 /NCGR_PEP_ID=MMETSP0736-20130129/12457_1 /TAXON_ID=186038 /ORGANISM="Fragilariopsis kerguelensis, Strain L26-C5" /LENGTH=169 /DNA_ID=CAMNT_0011423323 /DNA_START=231 /DNA_END=736 /DNA_ORIENTATION=-
MTKDVKQEEYTGKIKILNRGVNENGIDMVENKEEEDGEEDGVEVQQQSNTIIATMMADWSDLCHRFWMESDAGVQDFWMESAKGYDISMKDVVPDGKECDVAGEPQGNTVRRKFRKFGLKKMENMKEGNYTGEIMNLTVPVNERKNGMMTTIEEYEGEEDGAKEEEKVG